MCMVERPDGKLELIRVPHIVLQIGDSVAVRVDVHLTPKHSRKTFPFKCLR